VEVDPQPVLPAFNGSKNNGAGAVRAIARRLNRLEDRLGPAKVSDNLRIVVSLAADKANLAKATCKRFYCADGRLMETVELNGSDDGLTGEELDRFVQRFPITAREGKCDPTLITQA
jgi:hypothetical protein